MVNSTDPNQTTAEFAEYYLELFESFRIQNFSVIPVNIKCLLEQIRNKLINLKNINKEDEEATKFEIQNIQIMITEFVAAKAKINENIE